MSCADSCRIFLPTRLCTGSTGSYFSTNEKLMGITCRRKHCTLVGGSSIIMSQGVTQFMSIFFSLPVLHGEKPHELTFGTILTKIPRDLSYRSHGHVIDNHPTFCESHNFFNSTLFPRFHTQQNVSNVSFSTVILPSSRIVISAGDSFEGGMFASKVLKTCHVSKQIVNACCLVTSIFVKVTGQFFEICFFDTLAFRIIITDG